ncbi:MAG TPA: permease prefix domain 1-containing protein, partial [Alphaproteobacteria bacterium]|nr:permease prefix domain 1-containing protein [Alphaproteobacteria bacterium]
MSWKKFFRRNRWDDERTRELEAYLEIETAQHVASGMSPGDARSAALRKLGNPTRIREEIYSMNTISFVETLAQDVRYALRGLRLNPGFAVIAI